MWPWFVKTANTVLAHCILKIRCFHFRFTVFRDKRIHLFSFLIKCDYFSYSLYGKLDEMGWLRGIRVPHQLFENIGFLMECGSFFGFQPEF